MIELQTASNHVPATRHGEAVGVAREAGIHNLTEKFQSYDDLFDHLIDRENHKMLEREPDFKNMQWGFTTYSPFHAQTLYTHLKDQNAAVREALENQLPLIEICTGDFSNPEYVVVAANLDIKALKKKWALDYCAAHNMSVTGTEEETEA